MGTDEPAIQTTHYDNGKVKMSGGYLGDDMHGDWAWYRRDGSLMRTGAFDRGTQIGVWRTFDRAGKVVKETDFADRR